MDRCDLDHDGKIDYGEFIQAAIDHQSILNKKNIESVFKIFDLDHDGRISISELKYAFNPKNNINVTGNTE